MRRIPSFLSFTAALQQLARACVRGADTLSRFTVLIERRLRPHATGT